MFVELVRPIRAHGCLGWFHAKTITCFDEDGGVCRAMGAPVEGTTVIHGSWEEQTDEYQFENGTLPPG